MTQTDHTLRVLIVDDSRIFRHCLAQAIEGLANVVVVASEHRPAVALQVALAGGVDLILLDLCMPEMDGIAFLRALRRIALRHRPRVILISGAHPAQSPQIREAFELGVIEFLPKPASAEQTAAFSARVRELVAAFASHVPTRSRSDSPRPAASVPVSRGGPANTAKRRISLVAIVASTGGPKALASALPGILASTRAPIAVVQHIPPDFVDSLAANLSRACAVAVRVANDGESLLPATVYLAPAYAHLLIARGPLGYVARLDRDAPPEEGCKPSGNPFLRSVADCVGPDALALCLTGMGRDGCLGMAEIKRAGGVVLAQTEQSSVVWGMPGAVVQAGLADAEVEPSQVGSWITALVSS